MEKRNKGLQVIGGTKDAGDQAVDRVVREIEEEDDWDRQWKRQMREEKKKRRTRYVIIIAMILVVVAGAFSFIYLQTYTAGNIIAAYDCTGSGNNNYLEFGRGVIKYSKDGIALVDRRGEEVWNCSYQIKNPIINTCLDKAIVVANKGGNEIVVLTDEGEKGRMKTTLPIQKVVVSAQGIVCAMLDASPDPKIMCYDAEGNPLVEIQSALSDMGYPLDIGISQDGTQLMVSALSVENRQVQTKVSYYDFAGKKDKKSDYLAAQDEYQDMVGAAVFYMGEDTPVIVGDNQILVYKAGKTPKINKTIKIDKKIKNVFYNQKYFGIVLKNEGQEGYELCLYNTKGDKVIRESFTGDYSNVKVSGGQVIMYDGKMCSVYTRNGTHRFEGELPESILEICPIFGVNKYIVMTANGMQVIRFVK